jgi:hypothetical protein
VSTGSAPVPPWLSGLVDDAAIFPPGNSPLPAAVTAHRGHTEAPYGGLVGPFVVSDPRITELLEVVSTSSTSVEPLPVSVVVTGGAGALEPAVRWATRSGALDLRSLEITLRDDDTGAIVHNARRILAAVDNLRSAGALDDEVPVFVEPPRLYGAPPTPGWLGALDEIAAADAFPAAHELAASIEAAIDREVAFKCTAGLHNAVRHRDDGTGFEHHGFLNVVLATRATLDSADVDEVAATLEQSEPAAVRARVDEVGADGLASARRWFTSFGSCSILEPVEDLVGLGLLPGTVDGHGETTQEDA